MPRRRWRRFFAGVFRWTGFLLAFALFLSLFAPVVSPSTFWPFAFFGLLQPLFFILNFLFMVTWIIARRRRTWIIHALVLLLSLHYSWREFNFIRGENAPKTAIKIMSYNVKVFDLYNWSHNLKTRSKMFGLIRDENPDVLCIQEFYHQDSSKYSNLDSLLRSPGYKYYHVVYTTTLRKEDHWGVVTFSRYPILNKGEIIFNNRVNNTCIYTDLLIGRDTVRVYNMHLQSIAFNKDDHRFLEQMTKLSTEEEIEGSMNILRRMKRAYVKRANQSEAVLAHMKKCPYRIIACGDLNDTPISFTYNTISSGLEDAFLVSGRGFGKSFVNPFPLPRIDYIFHDPSFSSYEFHVRDEAGLSDHFPIVCRIKL